MSVNLIGGIFIIALVIGFIALNLIGKFYPRTKLNTNGKNRNRDLHTKREDSKF